MVLGVAQDGGLPHIGCVQAACVEARRDPERRQRVAALGLVDDAAGQRFLIDATPDLPSQLESLNGGQRSRAPADRRKPVDGILLTHAHVGHYTGLMYLGREALGAQGVPVFGQPEPSVAAGRVRRGPSVAAQRLPLRKQLRVQEGELLRAPHQLVQADQLGGVLREGCFVERAARLKALAESIDESVVQAHHLQLSRTDFLRLAEERYDALATRRERAATGDRP